MKILLSNLIIIQECHSINKVNRKIYCYRITMKIIKISKQIQDKITNYMKDLLIEQDMIN